MNQHTSSVKKSRTKRRIDTTRVSSSDVIHPRISIFQVFLAISIIHTLYTHVEGYVSCKTLCRSSSRSISFTKIRNIASLASPLHAATADIDDDDDNDDGPLLDPLFWEDVSLSRNDLENLTVTQLRQQLRLRGLKISGKKSELIDRLLGNKAPSGLVDPIDDQQTDNDSVNTEPLGDKSKARQFAESRGKELIDVTDYLEEEDRGKDTKSFKVQGDDLEQDPEEVNEKTEKSPETWGSEAKIVDDYEGRSVVVDGLSRTVVEYKGSSKKPVNAYVVASRESLKVYLAGGDRGNSAADLETATKNIQLAKEKASKVPMKPEDEQGEDVDDEEGIYKNILERDYGDWGKYSMTGAQLSAQEVKGVLLLSDVRGPFCDDMRALADKIAFECQPAVVFAPDLFRGKPWNEDASNPGYNAQGESYEEWRATHPEERVSVDIRAAAAALREQYGVSSVSLFGTCYGGGRALEATARVYPGDTMDDVNQEEGPPHVDPSTTIAWYPTRYDAEVLFGKGERKNITYDRNRVNTAVMAIFASEDDIPGATPQDAALLKSCLQSDRNVKDYMVKVFQGQKHGFAHVGIATRSDNQSNDDDSDRFLEEEFGGIPTNSMDDGDAEVAALLSTAWMETYARQFLPTVGEAVKDDEIWSELDMPDLSESHKRNIRAEIDEAIQNHEDVELDLRRMHPDDFRTPIDDLENIDEDFYKALQTSPYGASLEDDPDTFLSKLEAAIDRGDIDFLPGFGEIPMDDSVDGPAYW